MDASIAALKEHHEQLKKRGASNRPWKWPYQTNRWTSSAEEISIHV